MSTGPGMSPEQAAREVAYDWLLAEAKTHGKVTERTKELLRQVVDSIIIEPKAFW